MMRVLKHIPENLKGRDFVVGDLHGEYDKLMNQLSGLNFDPEKDRLFSVGDLGDRGRKSFDCAMLTACEWFHAVRGNHEQLYIDTVANHDQDATVMLMGNGGAWVYDLMPPDRTFIVQQYMKLPYAIEVPRKGKKFGIVHADVTFSNWKSIDITESEAKFTGHPFIPSLADQLLWGRTRISTGLKEVVHNIDHIFVGHTPIFNQDVTLGNVSYLDTGSVWDENRPLKIISLDDYLDT